MALYVLADTHLSASVDKPMDVFGSRWRNYTEKLREGFEKTVTDGDTVVIPGDISWAMTIEEAAPDFKFLSGLPGKKIVSRGNHDYYWSGIKKLTDMFESEGIDNISILQNNSYLYRNIAICGSRGWYPDERNAPAETDWDKLINREKIRLEFSLKDAEAKYPDAEKVVFLHFPPVWNGTEMTGLTDLMKEHGVKRCFFGHIHGEYDAEPETVCDGISYRIISSDYLNFIPYKISE